MRTRYTFIAVMMAILLLFVSAGCSQNNDYDRDDEDEDVTQSVQQSEEVSSETTDRPEAPTQEERPSRTEKPETSVEVPAATEGYSVGNALPDFSVPLAGGGTFTLSDHLGQPVFVNLFATWCPPCVGEMPEIDQLYGEYGDQVAFIAIDIGEDEATAQDFADSTGYSLPFAYSLDGAPFSGYTIQFIPQTFVVDANGVITAYFDGSRDYDTFQAAIEEALNS